MRLRAGVLAKTNEAEELGWKIIKLFHGSTYGLDFVKAVKGPQHWNSIMPTGGVNIEKSNPEGWFNTGVVC